MKFPSWIAAPFARAMFRQFAEEVGEVGLAALVQRMDQESQRDFFSRLAANQTTLALMREVTYRE